MSLSLLFAAIGALVTIAVGYREHAAAQAARRVLLDPCLDVLADAKITHEGDGFPRLEGLEKGRLVRAELLCDTMAMRRLPQLWLKLTRIEARPDISEFSVLVRPSGTEFFSLTAHHGSPLRPPQGLAQEVIARGSTLEAQRLLDEVAPALRHIFADPRIKEIAVTAKGLRLIWQAAEGHRGEHLLLRQCQFGDAAVAAEALVARLADLDRLSAAVETAREAQAA
jgi:hypothetical protein